MGTWGHSRKWCRDFGSLGCCRDRDRVASGRWKQRGAGWSSWSLWSWPVTLLCLTGLWSPPGARYHALLIPSCPGALADLASSGSLARILQHFRSESSR